MSEIGNLAVIAGGGALPMHVVEGAKAAGIPVRVAQIAGQGESGRFGVTTREFPLAAFGALSQWLRDGGTTHVCFAGQVARPDFSALKPDRKALKYMPSVAKASRRGDEALLQAVVAAFEAEGFAIVSPQSIAKTLLAPEGRVGRVTIPAGAREDILKACETAREMGRLDIGQAAVVCDGVVLAVEAQEGTAAMLRRVAALPVAVRGTPALRKGILAKMLKPGQDGRTDLPTIGVETVQLAAAAGIAGIVVEAGRAFILEREAMVELADREGMFVMGLPE